MRFPFGFHVIDEDGHQVDLDDLTPADWSALAQIDDGDSEDEEEI